MLYKIHNGTATISVDLNSLNYIDGYGIVKTAAIIDGQEHIVRGIVNSYGTVIEKIKAYCHNIINLGNGIYVYTVQVKSDFGERCGEIWKESEIRRVDNGQCIHTLDKFEGEVYLAETNAETSKNDYSTVRLLNIPSKKYKGKRTIYNVNNKKEISAPFDEIGLFAKDESDGKYKATAVINIIDEEGEKVDRITCTIDSSGNLASSLIQSERFGNINLDSFLTIEQLIEMILNKINNKELVCK